MNHGPNQVIDVEEIIKDLKTVNNLRNCLAGITRLEEALSKLTSDLEARLKEARGK